MDDKDGQIEALSAENEKHRADLGEAKRTLAAFQQDRRHRIQDAWARFTLTSAIAVASGLFFWCLTFRLLRSAGLADAVLATTFGIAALWAISVFAVLRALGNRR